MSRGVTYHFKGDKNVSVRKCQGEKIRITVVLGILSKGKKLPPFLIHKSNSKSQLENNWKHKLIIKHNANGWITEELMLDWIKQVFLNFRVGEDNDDKMVKYQLFDSCSSHLKVSVKDAVKDSGSLLSIIPPGCTSLLQPLDTSINKPFKDGIRRKFHAWFASEGNTEANKTPKGNLRAPSRNLIHRWVVEAWDEVRENDVFRSFMHCGKLNKRSIDL